MNSTWGFKLIRKPNSLTDSLIQINASVWSFGFFAASAARATWNDGDKDYISMLTKSFCGRITPKPNSSLSVITFHLGQSKLISCFASQGKILHPQHGLFLFIKFTRQAIYCCSVDSLNHSCLYGCMLYSDFGTTMFQVFAGFRVMPMYAIAQ